MERKIYKYFEGGVVLTAEEGGKFLVILDESAMRGLLSEEDLEGFDLVKTIEFETEAERSSYLLQRFGPPATG